MKRLAFIIALLCATPALAKTVSITGVAQDQSGTSAPTVQKLSFAAGETGEIDIAVTHPDGTAYNLTSANLTLAVSGQVISRQATIINASAGTAKFPLAIADTLNLLGTYTYDVTLTATGGSFYRVVPASSFVVTAGIGQPGQPVTVPPSQQPLAQGPAGPVGPSGPAGTTGPQGPSGTSGTLTASSPLTGGGLMSSNVSIGVDSTVVHCTPTTVGDYCGWNGTNWIREPAPSGGGGVTWPLADASQTNIGTAQTVGLSLQQPTAATAGVPQQFSPALEFTGHRWSGGTTDRTGKILAQLQPQDDSTYVDTRLYLYADIGNGSGYAQQGYLGVGIPGYSSALALMVGTIGLQITNSTASLVYGGYVLSLGVSGGSINTTFSAPQYVTTPAAATLVGTNTIAPTNGYQKLTYTSATNVTAMTISAGTDGQALTVQLSQPAAGTAATMVTTWTNVNFAGGAGSFTATLGKHDVYRFIYDGTAAKWQEVSRSLNQTN